MKLYSYWRSSASYRVRIVLGLKGLAWETVPVHLVRGEQRSDDHLSRNPQGLVPALELPDGTILTQSLAIIDFLDATHPKPRMLPEDPLRRQRVSAAALSIASEVQPVTNFGVVQYLKAAHDVDAQGGIDWMIHFMEKGFAAYQRMIDQDAPFSFGNQPTLADICLIPQLYNAHRWGVDLAPFRRLTEIEANCLALPAFDAARPEAQPDAET